MPALFAPWWQLALEHLFHFHGAAVPELTLCSHAECQVVGSCSFFKLLNQQQVLPRFAEQNIDDPLGVAPEAIVSLQGRLS